MATALTQKELCKCPICFERLFYPRKLPECFHAFCENCLLTYFLNIKSNDELSLEFQCPVCRRQITFPTASFDSLQDWVNSFELDLDMESSSKLGEDESVIELLCNTCKEVEKSVPAQKYCLDCQECICERCSSVIHAVRLMKNHTIFDLNEFIGKATEEKLQQMFSKNSSCSKHPGAYISHICMDEDMLCCIKCVVASHRLCSSVVEIEDQVSKLEDKAKTKNMKEKIGKILSQIKIITDCKKVHVSESKKKEAKTMAQVEEIRAKVNILFDSLIENLRTNTTAIIKRNVLAMEEETEKLQEIKSSLKVFCILVDKTQREGIHNHMFITLHKLNTKLREFESTVLEMGQVCKKNDFELKVEEILNEFMALDPHDTDRLATVDESISELTLPGFPEKQNLINCRADKEAELEILAKNMSDCPEYSGCVFLNSGQLVLADTNYGFCCLTNENYKTVLACNMSQTYGKPFSVTSVQNRLIAISMIGKRKICFISEQKLSDDFQISGYISTRFTPRALCGLNNGDIAVSWKDPVAFGILNFSCSVYESSCKEIVYFCQDTAGRVLKSFDYMYISIDEKRSHVLQPCTTDRAVYCFDFKGNPKFAYTHKDLVCPRGTACDGDGNIYVCDENQSSIHILSPDGVGNRVIKEGCPEKPMAIGFNVNGTHYAVTHRCSTWRKVTFFRLICKQQK